MTNLVTFSYGFEFKRRQKRRYNKREQNSASALRIPRGVGISASDSFMSFLVILLCGVSALLISLVITFLCAGGLAAKEALGRKTGKFRGRFAAVFVVPLCLTPGFKPYLGLWQTVSGFWGKLFLAWLAVLTLMVVAARGNSQPFYLLSPVRFSIKKRRDK